jgi:hypothetical protein
LKHESAKQGEYSERKKKQLGDIEYLLLLQKAAKTMSRRESILELMAWLNI